MVVTAHSRQLELQVTGGELDLPGLGLHLGATHAPPITGLGPHLGATHPPPITGLGLHLGAAHPPPRGCLQDDSMHTIVSLQFSQHLRN